MEWPAVSWNSMGLPRRAAAVEPARGNEIPIDDARLRPYHDRVARIAHLLMGDSCDASRVIQETFLTLSRDTQDLRGDSSLRILVFRVAVSTIQNRQRWWDWLGRRSSTHPAMDEEAADVAIVRHGLRCLPRRHRWILVLRDIEGMSYPEISEVLGLPIDTVKLRLMHARRQMLSSVARLE